MIPRFGTPPIQGQKYIARPGAYVIALKERDVLLTFQSAPNPEFQIPGGGIDPGENPLQALHREVREETGWRIAYPRLIGRFRRFVFMPEYNLMAEKMCHIFVARAVRQIHQPIEAGHSAHLVDVTTAHTQVENPGDAHFLRYVASWC